MLSESTSLHWHGLHQLENPFMDGTPYLQQCPILPRQRFKYEFIASNPGTHFWHSHLGKFIFSLKIINYFLEYTFKENS